MGTYFRGHRQRIKERFLCSGFNGWKEYEILEFALTFAVARKDTKQTAKELIEKFGSLKNVLNSDTVHLEQIRGIKKHAALFISFLKFFSVKYSELELAEKKKITSPCDVAAFLKSLIGSSKDEIFYAVFMNSANRILAYDEITRGVVNKSAVYPRKIVELALKYNATAVIISHNHPGGSCIPSQNDIIATEAVAKALRTVDISLLDHIIVADKNHYSFKDKRLI